MTLEQLVTFAILMESHDGILYKSPRYIAEKWKLCSLTTALPYLEGLLDSTNKAKLAAWLHRWGEGEKGT